MIFSKNPNSDVPILEIYEEIGQTTDERGYTVGISGKEFADYLSFIASRTDIKRIDIYINSLGGSIVEGLTIYNAIKSCEVQVNTVCVGVAVSMAGIILQAGKRRQITKSGLFMMHDPSGGEPKELEKLKGTLVSILCERTNQDAEKMGQFMSDTTWYDCNECLEMKIVDDIIDITSEANLPTDIKKEAPKAVYQKLKSLVNKIDIKDTPNPIKKPTMNKVKNFLNLDEATNEDEMLASVKRMKNIGDSYLKVIKSSLTSLNKMLNKKDEDEDEDEDSATSLKKTVTDMKAAVKKMNDEMEDLKKTNIALKAENETLKNAKNELEGAGLKAEAEVKVQDAVDKGKIKAEVKQKWVDLYVADKDETVALLDGIAVKPGAAKMVIESSKVPGAKKDGSASNQVPGGLTNFLKTRRRAITEQFDKDHGKK